MKPLDWHQPDFAQLVGARDTLPHALLVRGPRGIGKIAFAQALAEALLCESPLPGGDACGTCSACGWFAKGTHPDYRLVEPESESESGEAEGEETAEPQTKRGKKPSIYIRIEQIRALADFINITSHRGRAKAIVLHPAEALYPNAANALLKSLEEPPPRTHFILVTHRPQQLLPTVKSRCRHVPLAPPSPDAAIAWLRARGVRQPELALAHTGNAPLLAAELDQEPEYWGARAAFLRQLCAPEIDVIAAADAVSGYPVPHVLAWLQKWSYDIASQRTLGTVRYNPDQREAIARAAARIDSLAVLRFHREMVKLQRDAYHPLNPRLFIEHLLLAYSDLTRSRAAAA